MNSQGTRFRPCTASPIDIDWQTWARHQEVEDMGGYEGKGRAVSANVALDPRFEEPGLETSSLGCPQIRGNVSAKAGTGLCARL